MKRSINTIQSLTFILLFLCIATISIAQQTKQEKKAAKAAQLKEQVEAKKYVFVANSVSPMGGRTRQLTSHYTLIVKPDTLICDLPYAGRAYSASIGSSDGGINFTSTDFQYSMTPGKKGGWDISIDIKSQRSEKLYMTISESGYANLRVSSTDRQSISFSGVIEQQKLK